ncbi:Uncharacterised protein [Corynebacterium ulcerans]|nr:Uncharacterised protein [Corynebacterium ulcerans]
MVVFLLFLVRYGLVRGRSNRSRLRGDLIHSPFFLLSTQYPLKGAVYGVIFMQFKFISAVKGRCVSCIAGVVSEISVRLVRTVNLSVASET